MIKKDPFSVKQVEELFNLPTTETKVDTIIASGKVWQALTESTDSLDNLLLNTSIVHDILTIDNEE